MPERVIASPLSLVTRSLNLIHYNLCGSLPTLSSFNAALLLVDTVRTLERTNFKVSTLFLAIKGGFDNANAYYPSGNSLHNYARGICHHRGEYISEPKLPE